MMLLFGILLFCKIIFILGFPSEEVDTNICLSEIFLELKPKESLNISNPGFEDSHYPANALCSWTITSSSHPDARFIVEFFLISIWPSFNCIFDGLVLFDGNSTSSPIIGKYCTGTPSRNVTTSGPNLYILFYTSDISLRQFKGFFLLVKEMEPEVSCTDEEITCHNSKCISRSLICNGIDECGDGTDEEKCESVQKVGLTPCGLTPITPSLGNDRIVGGKRALPGSWPWQCSLRRRDSALYGHLCGAILIHEQWILTAAHCFRELKNANMWSVHLGKFYKIKRDFAEQVRYMKHLYIHPKFKFERSNNVLLDSKEYDIALAKLNAPAVMTKFVRTVCLPPWRATTDNGVIAYVTGWGETLGTGNFDVLKQAAVPIVSKESCIKSYRKIMNISNSMICAGYDAGGHDSCKGDSGGPLVIQKRNRWYLIGLVSTGITCAASMQPGIYTSVSYFKAWISYYLD